MEIGVSTKSEGTNETIEADAFLHCVELICNGQVPARADRIRGLTVPRL